MVGALIIMSKKILHFSDLHAGHREIDENDFEELYKAIIENSTDKTGNLDDVVLVFTGDLFHKRVSVDSDANKWVLKLFSIINKLGLDAIFLQGTRSHDYDYMQSLVEDNDNDSYIFPNIYFIEEKSKLLINDLLFLCLPEEYIDVPKEEYYTELNGEEKYDVVLFHGTIGDVAHYNTGIESVPFKKAPTFSKKEMWNLSNIVLFVNIHEHQVYRNKDNQYLSYVGSWGVMEHSEQDKKYGRMKVYHIDKKDKDGYFIESIDNIFNYGSSQFITLKCTGLGNTIITQISNNPEIQFDLDMQEDIDKFYNTILKFTNNNIKTRIKVLNEIEPSVHSILKKLVSDNPLVKITLVKDVRKEQIKLEQEEIIESINEYKEIDTIEGKVKHFVQKKYGIELDDSQITEVIS